jgi:hypothetical protein
MRIFIIMPVLPGLPCYYKRDFFPAKKMDLPPVHKIEA